MTGLDTSFLVQVEIQEADGHGAALELLRREILGRDREAGLAPQVLSEFIHVVTDPRRFERPLTMAQALAKAGFWWHATEVERIVPDEQVAGQFLAWMREHGLGRQTAARYAAGGHVLPARRHPHHQFQRAGLPGVRRV